MSGEKKEFAIAVSEDGIHIMVDDILSPEEAMFLQHQIGVALSDWCKLTGKLVGGGKPK